MIVVQPLMLFTNDEEFEIDFVALVNCYDIVFNQKGVIGNRITYDIYSMINSTIKKIVRL